MGLSSVFVIIPPPSRLAHRANDGLPAGVDVHVLDGNLLVPFPSIALQCLSLGREGSQKFHREISVAVLLGDPFKRRSARVAAKCVANIWTANIASISSFARIP